MSRAGLNTVVLFQKGRLHTGLCKQDYKLPGTGRFSPALVSIARASAGAPYPALTSALQKAWKLVQNNPMETHMND